MLRHLIYLFLLSFLTTQLAYANNDSDIVPVPENNIVVATVATGSDKASDALVGALIADYKQGDPNALDIIRAALNKIQNEHQAKAEKNGVLLNTTYRFTPESLTFFAAIGLVTVNSMWIKSEGDPLAMEKHILSLKDPIAHMSFYAFMLTNGFYMDFQTSGAGYKLANPSTQARMMRRFNYQGMAIGSLASSIVSDLGQSGKMCIDSWILHKDDEQSKQYCNEAWKSWTVRNKFTQYFPQIISMWASQAASDLFDRGVRKAFSKTTTTELAGKLLNKEWLVKQAYKVTGAEVALTFAGGTWAMKSIRLIGSLTKFTMFVGIDHVLSPFIYRPLNNLIRPLFFDFDAYEINKYWQALDTADWDETQLKIPQKKCLNPTVGIPVVGIFLQFVNQPKCEQPSIENTIENYGVQVQQWRDHLNADVEADLAGWMELTKELLNQMDYSYKFYRTFTDSIFETLNINYRVKQNPADYELRNNKSNYPFRTLPLYGISMGDASVMGGTADDLYLNKPSEIEKRQREHIKNTIALFETPAKKAKLSLSGDSLEKFEVIIKKLASDNTNLIAAGLNDINQILSMTFRAESQAPRISNSNSSFITALIELRNTLGKPLPVVYPLAGFTQAFTANSSMKTISDEADFSLWSVTNKYKFSKESDLMLYKIICGNKTASFEKTKVIFTNVDALSPQFSPPTLLMDNSKQKEFCQKFHTTGSLYTTNINGKSLSNYLVENLNYKIIGDYRDKNNVSPFDAWWDSNSKKSVAAEFTNFDLKFKELTSTAEENIFDQRSFYKWSADHLNQSKYLQDSLMNQFKTEVELYLQLIQRALTPASHKQLKKITSNTNYLENTVQSSVKSNFSALYGPTFSEIKKVSELMNSYYPIMLQKNVDFKNYINHSKKIDTAINDILVLAGLKKLEKGEADLFDSKEIHSENSDKVYTDIKLQKLNIRQRVIVAAVKGLRQVESETRRFIRMKVMLSKGLEIGNEEFKKDYGNELSNQSGSVKPRSANPRGT